MRKDNKTFIEMTTDELKKKLHDSRKSYSEIKFPAHEILFFKELI